jgi:hypothetical protein
MKYWELKENKAILKRQIINNNNKLVNHVYNNLELQGIRFLIKQDRSITLEEKTELLYIL